jgi:hypothetical protein
MILIGSGTGCLAGDQVRACVVRTSGFDRCGLLMPMGADFQLAHQ